MEYFVPVFNKNQCWMGRGEENKAKINESIAIKIISQTDTELRIQPEEGMGRRENNPKYPKNWHKFSD